MGAVSPAPALTPELERRALAEIVAPTVAALAAMGTPFTGVLFAGLMLTPSGPQLIEYNARFGDPECEALMVRLESDLVDLLLATCRRDAGRRCSPAWRGGASGDGRSGGERLSGRTGRPAASSPASRRRLQPARPCSMLAPRGGHPTVR